MLKNKRWFLFYGMPAIIFLLVPKVFGENNSATSIGKQYLNAMNDGDFKKAYELTGKAFKYAVSEAEFNVLPSLLEFTVSSVSSAERVDDVKEAKRFQKMWKEIWPEMWQIVYIDDNAKIEKNRASLLYIEK